MLDKRATEGDAGGDAELSVGDRVEAFFGGDWFAAEISQVHHDADADAAAAALDAADAPPGMVTPLYDVIWDDGTTTDAICTEHIRRVGGAALAHQEAGALEAEIAELTAQLASEASAAARLGEQREEARRAEAAEASRQAEMVQRLESELEASGGGAPSPHRGHRRPLRGGGGGGGASEDELERRMQATLATQRERLLAEVSAVHQGEMAQVMAECRGLLKQQQGDIGSHKARMQNLQDTVAREQEALAEQQRGEDAALAGLEAAHARKVGPMRPCSAGTARL